jgi:hypothetical protein
MSQARMAKNTTAVQEAKIHEAQVWLAIETKTWQALQTNLWAAIEARWARTAAAIEEAEFQHWARHEEEKEWLRHCLPLWN